MNVDIIEIGKLHAAAYNPRQMSEADFTSLVRSLREYGFVEPVVVNKKDNEIIGGHQRVRAAQSIGMKEVPVVWVDLTPERAKLLNMALNRIHGDWDEDKLGALLLELQKTSDVDLSLSGFTGEEISQMIDKITQESEEEFNVDKVISEIEKPESKLGEVYELGNHRLMCGDATSAVDVQRLLGDNKIDMVFTDPPYNVDYKSRSLRHGKKWKEAYGDDQWKDDEFEEFAFKAFTNFKQYLKKGGVFYICSGWSSWSAFWRALKRIELEPHGCIVWDKGHGGMGWSDYWYQHEFLAQGFNIELTERERDDVFETIVYGFDDRARHYFNRRRRTTDVWHISRDPTFSYKHPTQKPVKLIENALKNSSKIGDRVLDLFGGSGSTMEACQRLNRVSYTMELSPLFCDVIRKRYDKIKGQEVK